MRFSLVGINHQTAPIAIREKVAISTEHIKDALSMLRSYMPHGIILSTCNRTEIYTVDGDGFDGEKASLDFFKARLKTDDTEFLKFVYRLKDKAAAEHLFRVASGLESLVVGEFEVLGQVGNALEAAEKAGMANLPLRQIFHRAVGTGRLVRKETGISKNALSVSSIAVDLAADIVGDLKKCRLLVIGAGEAGRLVAKVAKERGTSEIIIASRTLERASALASKLGGKPVRHSNLPEELCSANIVVTCAGAPRYVLHFDHVAQAMKTRTKQPLVIIDIALPRNVEPEVGKIKDVFLYNIDDLTGISNQNRKQREGAVQKAEKIVMKEADKFDSWWQDFEARPVLIALMQKADYIRATQLNKTIKKLPQLSDEQQANLEAMTKAIVTNILKDLIAYLKTNGNGYQTELVKELFQLDTKKGSKGTQPPAHAKVE